MIGIHRRSRCALRVFVQTLALSVIVTACQTPSGLAVNRQLDPASGMTLVAADRALVFARTENGLSRSARDYVYVGPVETNRQGRRDYYLWVGIATTLDRGFVAPDSGAPASLLLDVGGTIMELPLVEWPDPETGPTSVELYAPAVDVHTALAARVTLDQLELITGEPFDSLRVMDASGRTKAYRRWDSGPSWLGFMNELAVSSPVASR
jgi:hypothetical protein